MNAGKHRKTQRIAARQLATDYRHAGERHMMVKEADGTAEIRKYAKQESPPKKTKREKRKHA